MRAKHNKPTTKYRGLLRRAVAVCTALAMVCGMAVPAFAVPMDVLNEETGLIETVDDTELYGEDYGYGYYDDAIAAPPPVENETSASSSADEAVLDSDKILDGAFGQTSTGKDEYAYDTDQLYDDSWSIAVYDLSDKAYYYDSTYSSSTDSNNGIFYSDSAHKNPIFKGTMEEFIKTKCNSGATIQLDTPYRITSTSNEDWSSTVPVTLMRTAGKTAALHNTGFRPFRSLDSYFCLTFGVHFSPVWPRFS